MVHAIGTGDVFELSFVGRVVATGTAVVLIVIGDEDGVLARNGVIAGRQFEG